MKFEKKEPVFRPIVITLETQEEIDLLHALTALAPGRYADSMTYKLYSKLDAFSSSEPEDYWTGSLGVRM